MTKILSMFGSKIEFQVRQNVSPMCEEIAKMCS